MPYPNEHAARLADPGEFKEKPDWSSGGKFRRTKDGTIHGKTKVPSSVSVIWGQLKSQSGKSAAPQSLRFPTSSWTAEKAKAWLKSNNVSYKSFEAARKEMSLIAKELCCTAVGLKFSEPELVDDGGEITVPVELVARTNSPAVKFGMRLYHELSGAKIKDKIPLDWQHDPDEIVGYLDKFNTTKKEITCSGSIVSISPTDRANEIVRKASHGVPYEASIFFGGNGLKAVELGEQDEMEVNGENVKGPAIVFKEWPLRGVAICPYGADSKTGVRFDENEEFTVSFLDKEENIDMAEDVKDLELDDGQEPVLSDIPAADTPVEPPVEPEKPPTGPLSPDGLAGKEFLTAFGDFGAIAFANGLTFAEASAEYIVKLQEEVKELKDRLANTDRGLNKPIEPDNYDDEEEARQKAISELTNRIGNSRARIAAGINVPKR